MPDRPRQLILGSGFAPFRLLKEIDARTIRERVLGCLERASLPTVSDEERRTTSGGRRSLRSW
jgi:hypothetical protein